MKKFLYPVLLLIVLLVAIFGFTAPAFAISLPDSTPTAEFFVWRNVLSTGDWLLVIHQNIPYTTIPDDPVWQSYMWRFLAADNVTELGTALPYTFSDNGYGYTVTSMYWDAGNVTASGMVWNTPYQLRLSGSPVAFTTPPEYNFTLSSSDYSVLTNRTDVQSAIGARLLLIAADLDINWGLGITYSLLTETETGTVLSIYGEAFFRGAIYGLQGMCPEIFAYVINDLDLTPRTWSNAYVLTLQNQYTGTWVDTAKAAGAALFGTAYDLTALLISILAAAVLGICTMILCGDAWQGISDARTGLIVATRLGFFDLGFLGLLAALAVIYGSSRLWGVMR